MVSSHGIPTVGNAIVNMDSTFKTCAELEQELEEQRDRLSRLSAASVLVSETLDCEHRSAAGRAKRSGVDRRRLRCHRDDRRSATAPGRGLFRPDPRRAPQPAGLARRLLLFAHFRDLPRALRVPDLAAYAKSLDFPFDLLPTTTYQATPMIHRGVGVGNSYLGQKEGARLFADEEVLSYSRRGRRRRSPIPRPSAWSTAPWPTWSPSSTPRRSAT